MRKDKGRINKNIHRILMGEWCLNCGKAMKNLELTHCSDECLLEEIKQSETLDPSGQGAETWNEESRPWT